MELTLTSRLRRAAQPVRTEVRREDGGTAAPARPQVRGDRLTLSREAATYLEERNRLFAEQFQQAQREKKRALWDMEEPAGDEELKAMGEALKTTDKCQKIAARIMRGDKVPPQDERYLRENDPEGYKLAMAMRTPKRNPKKWKSVLDKEDKAEGAESAEEAEAASEAAPEAGAGDGAGSGADSGCE